MNQQPSNPNQGKPIYNLRRQQAGCPICSCKVVSSITRHPNQPPRLCCPLHLLLNDETAQPQSFCHYDPHRIQTMKAFSGREKNVLRDLGDLKETSGKSTGLDLMVLRGRGWIQKPAGFCWQGRSVGPTGFPVLKYAMFTVGCALIVHSIKVGSL